MSTPLIIWLITVAATIATLSVKAFKSLNHKAVRRHHGRNGRLRPVSIGTEREELYVPGDRMYGVNSDYGDDY